MENPKYRLMNVRKGKPPQQRTYIVIGLGRSGTTFVSSILDYLGIFLGSELNYRNLEDDRLSIAIESHDYREVEAIISDYNNRHDIWAYKRPNMTNVAGELEHLFRNLHYIFVHRDLFAISLRNEIAIGRDILEGLDNSMASAQRMRALIAESAAPSLHVCFELMAADPRKSAELIADFVVGPDHRSDFHSDKFADFMAGRREAYHSGKPQFGVPQK